MTTRVKGTGYTKRAEASASNPRGCQKKCSHDKSLKFKSHLNQSVAGICWRTNHNLMGLQPKGKENCNEEDRRRVSHTEAGN